MLKKAKIEVFHSPKKNEIPAQLKLINGKSVEHRNMQLKDARIRLRCLEECEGIFVGEVIKYSPNDPVFVASDTTEKPLSLQRDHGIREQNAFLYSAAEGFLLYQRNRKCVPIDQFIHYLENMTGAEPSDLAPVLSKDIQKRLDGFTRIGRFHFRAATAVVPADAAEGSIYNIASSARAVESPFVEVIMSVGKHRDGLNRERILSWVSQILLLKAGHSGVKTLRIGGSDGKSPLQTLDLFNANYKAEVDFNFSASVEASFRSCKDALETLWRDRKRELMSIVST